MRKQTWRASLLWGRWTLIRHQRESRSMQPTLWRTDAAAQSSYWRKDCTRCTSYEWNAIFPNRTQIQGIRRPWSSSGSRYYCLFRQRKRRVWLERILVRSHSTDSCSFPTYWQKLHLRCWVQSRSSRSKLACRYNIRLKLISRPCAQWRALPIQCSEGKSAKGWKYGWNGSQTRMSNY